MSLGRLLRRVAISVDLPAPIEGDVPSGNNQAIPAETFYLGTNHGIYEIQRDAASEFVRIGITNGALLGRRIQALTTGGSVIYAGTPTGLYRYYKVVPVDAAETVGDNVTKHPRALHRRCGAKWEGTPFDTCRRPSYQHSKIGITPRFMSERKKGLYSSKDSGQTWREVAPEIYGERSIVSIVSVVDANGDRTIYVASTAVIDDVVL